MSYLKKYFANVLPHEQTSAAIAFIASLDTIGDVSPQTQHAIIKELKDQRSNLKLIASENYSSLACQMAMGNLLTDKYSEGYVNHRFYAGCENVDTVEDLAVELAKKIFGADHAYVQPHSGADANLVAFWAVLVQRVQNKKLEDLGRKTLEDLTKDEYEDIRKILVSQKIMGLALGSGGHLTHGFRHNISSKIFQAVSYDVNPQTGLIDYLELEKAVLKEKPLILIAGYSAYPRLIDFSIMREIADKAGAVLMVDMAHFSGLVAGKVMTGVYDPVPYAHIVTSTTHKTLRGPRGGMVLCTNEFKDIVNKGCPLVLGGPLPHVMAAKAVAFQEILEPGFKTYAHQIVKNAQALAETLIRCGVNLLTNGTDNHLLVIDVAKSFQLTGRQAETILREAHLTVNRNSIPQDPNGAWYTSGVRLGTAAVTTLGMKEEQMREIGMIVYELLKNTTVPIDVKTSMPSRAKAQVCPDTRHAARDKIHNILKEFPLYPELVID